MLAFENAAVTVIAVSPAFSDTLDGSIDRSMAGASSLSARVTRSGVTGRSAWVPETVIVSSPSTRLSSTGVSSTVALPLVFPAAMITSKPGTAA